MIFSYKRLPGNKYGPIVPLHLQGRSSRWLLFNAFVDTGADYSVFHSDVAIMLGLKLIRGIKKTVTVGDGDQMTIYLHDVPVRFASQSFEAKIAFSEWLGAGFNLMGRATFFEKYQFCFNDRTRILRVSKSGGAFALPVR